MPIVKQPVKKCQTIMMVMPLPLQTLVCQGIWQTLCATSMMLKHPDTRALLNSHRHQTKTEHQSVMSATENSVDHPISKPTWQLMVPRNPITAASAGRLFGDPATNKDMRKHIQASEASSAKVDTMTAPSGAVAVDLLG